MKHLSTAFASFWSITAICFLGSCNPDPELIETYATNANDDGLIGSWRAYNFETMDELDLTYHFLYDGIAFVTRDDEPQTTSEYAYWTSSGVIFLGNQFGAGTTWNYEYAFNSDSSEMTWSFINGSNWRKFTKLD